MPELSLANHELRSPLINAAGSVNGVHEAGIMNEVEKLAASAIGAITVGSFTISAQEGNEAKFGAPVYYHDEESGETYNSMGLPNIGIERVVELAPEILECAHESDAPVIFSASPSKPEDGSSVEQAVQLVYRLFEAEADIVELNVSCPNVVAEGGDRKLIMGYDLGTMTELIDTLQSEVGEGRDLGVKLPPYLSEREREVLPQLADLFKTSDVFSFVVTANTIPDQVPVDENGEQILSVPEGKGGMSGPATKEVGREQLSTWHEKIGNEMQIVSALGVDSGREVREREALGAVASAGVTFLWESRNWPRIIDTVLAEYAETV